MFETLAVLQLGRSPSPWSKLISLVLQVVQAILLPIRQQPALLEMLHAHNRTGHDTTQP